MRLIRPIQTRFRFGSPSLVNLATYRHSQAHSSKGTPSWPPCGDDTLTVCKPTVSGTSSLSVAKEYLGLWGGPHRFTRIFSVPVLLGMTCGGCVCFEYGAITHYGRPFQNRSSTQQLGNSVIDLVFNLMVPRPRVSNATRLDTDTV